MLNLKTKTDWKYLKIEIFFFIFIAYLSPIISDLEYSFYEENNILNFTNSLGYRAVVGTFIFIFYSLYYWGFLKKYVFKKQYLYVLISMVCFIILTHLYNKYVMNLSMSKMNFLSEELKLKALKSYNLTKIYFPVNYTLTRVLFVIIGFTFLLRSLQQDKQLKTLREQKLTAELTYLKAQLQPHFFFNTLNNIYSLALQQSKDTAPLVAKLAEMMRYILYQSENVNVLLRDEISFIRNYVEAENIRYRSAIAINFEVQGNDDESKISPLLILPFVENAFKHGIQEETDNGFVNIVICKTETELNLEVTNSIAATKNNTGGVGLINVKKRLDLLYGENYKLEIESNQKIYKVSLTLIKA